MQMHEIQEAVRATPFMPFTVHLTDGRSLRVDHPEMIALGIRSVTIYVAYEDHMQLIAIRHITGLEKHDGGAMGDVA